MHSLSVTDCSTRVWTWLEKDVGDEELKKKNPSFFPKCAGNVSLKDLKEAGAVWQLNECVPWCLGSAAPEVSLLLLRAFPCPDNAWFQVSDKLRAGNTRISKTTSGFIKG